MKILVLCTDAFGGHGGIAKFNRDLLSALCACPDVQEVVALPRLLPEPAGPLPDKLNYDTSGVGGKLRYLLAAIRTARRMVSEIDTSPNPLPVRGGEGEAIGGGPASSRPSTLNPQPSTGFDLILCGHINLLPAAFLARAMMRRKPGRSGEAPRPSDGRGWPAGTGEGSAMVSNVNAHPLTPSLSPSDGERVAEGRVRGTAQPSTLNSQPSTPLVLIIHGIDAWQPTRSALVNRLVRRIDAFISVSEFTRKRFLNWAFPESGPRVTRPSGYILPNCVDLAQFTPGPKNPALLDRYGLRDRTVLLTVARLSADERYKGIDEVLEVLPELAKQIPNLSYLIVGDGTDRARLMDKARSLGLAVECGDLSPLSSPSPPRSGRGLGEVSNSGWPLECGDLSPLSPAGDSSPAAPRQVAANQSADKSAHSKTPSTLNSQLSTCVIFAGRIPESEKVDHYRLADAFVMPGRGEGFGIVYLEALACGVPVVASKVDASCEAVLNGELGIVVDPDKPQEIREGILLALRQNSRLVPDGLNRFSRENFQERCGHTLASFVGNKSQRKY